MMLWGRHRLDIRWRDIARALNNCVFARERTRRQQQVDAASAPDGQGMVCLSVRSAFDLYLEALNLPIGSEVLMSAITLDAMAAIVEAHGLIPVPIDLDPATLAPSPQQVEAAITKNTAMLVLVHLFGGRVELDPYLEIARRHRLLLVEDAAQDFRSFDARADRRADATFISLGPIKTATAFGGGIARVADQALLNRMRCIQETWPVQRRRAFTARVLRFSIVQAATSRLGITLVDWLCRLGGRKLDQVINEAAHSFGRSDPAELAFFEKVRRQPSAPLLATIQQRMRRYDLARLQRRSAIGARYAEQLHANGAGHIVLGGLQRDRTCWLFPVRVADPQGLIVRLRAIGVDCTQGATSIGALLPPAHRLDLTPHVARALLAHVVYLPCYHGLQDDVVDAIAACVAEHEGTESNRIRRAAEQHELRRPGLRGVA